MAVLLYADVLGMKQRWKRDVDEVLATYRRLERYVAGVLRRSGVYAEGGVQSDAVALVFKDASRAARVGRRLFERCFEDATQAERMWLRGLIIPYDPSADEMEAEFALRAGNAVVHARHFCRELLDAVNIEQSFKGPRLLINESLVDEDLRNALAIPLKTRQFWPVKRLRHSIYPDGERRFQDLLYLVPSVLDDERTAVMFRGREMSRRVRWASSADTGGSPEELMQVSALALTWMETEAIIGDLYRREEARTERT